MKNTTKKPLTKHERKIMSSSLATELKYLGSIAPCFSEGFQLHVWKFRPILHVQI